jgi:hypothetical protein
MRRAVDECVDSHFASGAAGGVSANGRISSQFSVFHDVGNFAGADWNNGKR